MDDETLMGEGRVYGGGLHKLEPRELGNALGDKILEVLPKKSDRSKFRSLRCGMATVNQSFTAQVTKPCFKYSSTIIYENNFVYSSCRK